MSEIEIVGDLEIVKPTERATPMSRAKAMGLVKAEDMQIFMPESVLKEIIFYSKTRMDVEVGGMLVGNLCSYRGVNWIDIKGYVRALKALQNPASLRFTHEACEAVQREIDRRHPGDIIVGWHHTHPGYSVFLSSTDMWTCRSWFNLPWNLALVVDPKADTMGFFQWKGDKMLPCGFYFTT